MELAAVWLQMLRSLRRVKTRATEKIVKGLRERGCEVR